MINPKAMENAVKHEQNYPFTFTGKEKDEETGFSYFGARYYDSDLSGLFLSVDPMADKYSNISPYAYCAWNPMKLIDPCGDSIRNAYETYKNVSEDIEYFQNLISKTNNHDDKVEHDKQINNLRKAHRNYHVVDDLLNDFEKTNSEEYDLLNNMCFNGTPIDVYVGLNELNSHPQDGSVGLKNIAYVVDENGIVQGIKNSIIQITIYKNGFADGYNGVGSLANEFGDVIFGTIMAQYNYDTRQNTYKLKPTTSFSYDYENFFISPYRNPRPDPKSVNYIKQ